MRLLNFRVKNFRGIGKGDGTGLQINLADQNIILLIGQNNVGKSSLLHAYDYFFNDRKAKIDDFFDKDTNNSIEIELLLELTNDESNEHFFLSNDKKDLRERYFQKISFKKSGKIKSLLLMCILAIMEMSQSLWIERRIRRRSSRFIVSYQNQF